MDVVLVEEHEALRDGLVVLLERHGITTIGTAGTVARANALLDELRPDVAVIGLRLPDGSGVRLVRRVHRDHPGLAILIYTGIDDVGQLAEAIESGARGFVLKPGGIDQLVRGLRLVAGGRGYIDPAITALVAGDVDCRRLLLTRRERQVFDLLAQDLTGEEIARQLTVSPETVRAHIRNGMGKLHAHTRTGAVALALRTHEIES
jgi:DNA-binding NarL/FixJ family response regulator